MVDSSLVYFSPLQWYYTTVHYIELHGINPMRSESNSIICYSAIALRNSLLVYIYLEALLLYSMLLHLLHILEKQGSMDEGVM